MKKFEVLEHKADLKVKVYGQDLTELFINAALAMDQQQNQEAKKQQLEDWEPVEIKSADQESLLVDWLSEILSRSDTYHKIYVDFKIEELTETKIRAKIKGVLLKEKYLDIKAVTYHGLEIKKIKDHWEAIVIFDI